jgi:RNA polymerase sigma-70 factor (ECF subfamily)
MDSDWRLMKRLCERDVRALAELYDRHGGRVFSLSAAILRDDAAAEECTQDVFVKLWHRPEQYRFDDNRFVVWLSLIARRTAIDRLRRAGSGADRGGALARYRACARAVARGSARRD